MVSVQTDDCSWSLDGMRAQYENENQDRLLIRLIENSETGHALAAKIKEVLDSQDDVPSLVKAQMVELEKILDKIERILPMLDR